MKKNTLFQTILLYFLIGTFILVVLSIFQKFNPIQNSNQEKYSYNSLIKDIEDKNVSHIKSLIITPDEQNSGKVRINFQDNSKHSQVLSIPSLSSFMELIHKNIDNSDMIITKPFEKKISSLPFIIIGIIIISIIIINIFFNQEKGISNRSNSFGKSKAKLIFGNFPKVTFKEVAGLREEKEDLEEIVEFLKFPQKFEEIGARIPKGILLVGPPGTGKTLLARAIAGEANVKFFSISGSDFVEMFVGVGASRVRDLFAEAKKNKPALIFIDEIDAVGRKRGSGLGGGHDEREQTLNQLLVEMDGFTKNEGIIVMAATNRPDILDPALLRPGRFDRQIFVGAPDVRGREDILKVHSKNKKIDESVSISEIAKMTSGFTGAELENLLNEAALLAAKFNCKAINMEHIKKAFIKVGVGTERKSSVISKEEKEITAYHEAGHAILFETLNLLDSVHLVSIIPTGSAGGYTMPLPVDKGYLSKNYLLQHIISLFGGIVSEDIIFEDITTGSSNDIERATKTAYKMVVDYGMSSLGPINFDSEKNSEKLSCLIDEEVEKIVSECYETAKKIIKENINILHACAKLLLEKEKISGDEFRNLFPENYLPKKKQPTLIEFNHKEKYEHNSENNEINKPQDDIQNNLQDTNKEENQEN